MTRATILIALMLFLSGCGQSGDLYLPKSDSASSLNASGSHGSL